MPAAQSIVNDVHSELNATTVGPIVQPTTHAELCEIVRSAARDGRSISICGSRHAMGGQQFLTGETLVDMRLLNRIIALDSDRGLVTAEAGIEWPALVAGYLEMQRQRDSSREPRWGIAQKQTGADSLTLGGALSANAHGRGLTMPPIVNDVESFTLVNATGEIVTCSRTQNSELFSLAIGGYGLFGVIVTVTLRLCERVPVRRVVRLIDIDDAVNAARRRINEGFIYGDFQFDIDSTSREFLTKGVFSCYEPARDAVPPAAADRELSAEDWYNLLLLAHTNKTKAFGLYAQHYVATDGQLYWSDTHQLGLYLDGYHKRIDVALGSPCKCSEMISELYVPHDRLVDFLHEAARMLAGRGAEVIYGTIRLIRKDAETFLPWAAQDQSCVIFNLHVLHTDEGLDHARESFRALFDLALDRGGRFFLTYHRWARRDQLVRGYPQLPAFLARKDFYDPAHLFSSDWHRWLRETIYATPPSTGKS